MVSVAAVLTALPASTSRLLWFRNDVTYSRPGRALLRYADLRISTVQFMPHAITISIADVEMQATLRDTPTAKAIRNILPLERTVNTWGHELYFDVGISEEVEAHASAIVQLGDLAFWPPGSAFCIFFGHTPASQGDEIRAASPVNIIGSIDDPPIDKLRRIQIGTAIRIAVSR